MTRIMHNVKFMIYDLMRTILSQDVRPSGCLSVCRLHAGILSKRFTYHQTFSPLGRQTILVFATPHVISIFRQAPPNWDVECRAV